VVTKRDIADYLGISRAAVSLVLNNSPSSTISASTRNKILQAAKELGYGVRDIPPKIGYVLYGRESNDPRYMIDLQIIEKTASRYNYGVLFLSLSSLEEASVKLQQLRDHQEIKGFVLSGDVDEKLIDIVQTVGIPYLLYGFPLTEPRPDLNVISTDDKKLTYEATSYLIALGHTRIALFTGSIEYMIHKRVIEGYLLALQEAGIEVEKSLIQISNEEDGYELCKRAHFLELDFTAISCANTIIQFGALQWLKDAGIAVPQEISLIGKGVSDLVKQSVPKLTTFCVSDVELEAIVTHLLDIIHSHDNSSRSYCFNNFTLLEGGTCGPPPIQLES